MNENSMVKEKKNAVHILIQDAVNYYDDNKGNIQTVMGEALGYRGNSSIERYTNTKNEKCFSWEQSKK